MQTSIDDFLGAKQEDKYRKVLFGTKLRQEIEKKLSERGH